MTKPMTSKRLQDIKARCEAATEGPWTMDKEAGADIIGNTDIIILEICCGIRTHATLREYNSVFITHARQDLPYCLDEIERLQGFIERIATDKGGDVWATFSFNPIEEARKVLEQIGTDAGD